MWGFFTTYPELNASVRRWSRMFSSGSHVLNLQCTDCTQMTLCQLKPKYTGKIYSTGLPKSRLTCVTTPSTLQNIQHAPTMNKNIRYGRGADHRQMHNNSKGMEEEILALFAYLSNPFLEQTFCSKYTFSHFFYIHTIDVKYKHISNYSLAFATRILLFDIP